MKASTNQRDPGARKIILLLVSFLFLTGLLAVGISWLNNRSSNNPMYHQKSQSSIKTPTKPLPTAEDCVAKLPLDFLVGQVLMVGLPASDLNSQAATFKQNNIGGAVVMTSPQNPNDGSIKQFKLSAESLGVQPIISTDEEGGSIQRFSSLGVLPSPAAVSATLSPARAGALIKTHGLKLKAVGIDMVLGPLADVGPSEGSGILEDRVFSSDPKVVASYDLAYVKGWRAAGLLPVLKHFPGMGSASANTDYSAATAPPLGQLEARDFVPYRQLVNSGAAVMVGNQNVPGWFSGPASLSPVVNKYLRQTLGYKDNLVVTDSLSAAAVTNWVAEPQAIDDAIVAGNDIALFVELPSSSLADNQNLISQAESLLKNSVANGALPKQQLVSSVVRKLDAQHINACTIKGAD